MTRGGGGKRTGGGGERRCATASGGGSPELAETVLRGTVGARISPEARGEHGELVLGVLDDRSSPEAALDGGEAAAALGDRGGAPGLNSPKESERRRAVACWQRGGCGSPGRIRPEEGDDGWGPPVSGRGRRRAGAAVGPARGSRAARQRRGAGPAKGGAGRAASRAGKRSWAGEAAVQLGRKEKKRRGPAGGGKAGELRLGWAERKKKEEEGEMRPRMAPPQRPVRVVGCAVSSQAPVQFLPVAGQLALSFYGVREEPQRLQLLASIALCYAAAVALALFTRRLDASPAVPGVPSPVDKQTCNSERSNDWINNSGPRRPCLRGRRRTRVVQQGAPRRRQHALEEAGGHRRRRRSGILHQPYGAVRIADHVPWRITGRCLSWLFSVMQLFALTFLSWRFQDDFVVFTNKLFSGPISYGSWYR
uniref:Uncharacterized protein n=1 Tax=Setaria viridis TaxID=4556 RepID=A0A4U6VDL2_SETVI|nr:hypothetical protein SEVIR_3G109600v2 [Setaria viridis]